MSESPRRPPRGVVAVAGWLAAAVLAAGVTLAAVTVIGSGIFGESTQTRSQAEIAQALASLTPTDGSTAAASPSPSASSTTSGSPPPESSEPSLGSSPPAPSRRLIASAGGSVLAQCTGRYVRVLSWTPAQGYRVGEVDQQARRDVEVRFEGEDDEVKVKIRCEDGRPVAETEQDD